MREPAFWHRPASFYSRLLLPLGALYGAVAGRRMQRPGLDAGIPVLCVGNYHTGGAGKTPTVLALTRLLRDLGETPVVLSRGYGGRLRGPVMVDPARHAAADVGDEPLMLARTVPVAVARDRPSGVALARSQGASVILMDDGFQNPAVAKDASLIVIDANRGLGNGCLFPAGPLRAPLDLQLARTDALIVIGDGTAARSVAAANRRAGEAGAVSPSEADRRLGGCARGQARAGLRRHRRSRPLLPDAARRWYRRGPGARLRRSSSVLARRDRGVDRGSHARRADAGDDGKGPGAAADARGDAVLGERLSCRSP